MEKVRPHNRVAEVMVRGDVVSPDAFQAAFEGTKLESLMYRLSVYMFDIRKYDNGIVKVVKDKRKVVGYQLVNWDLFDLSGRYTGKSRTDAADAEVASWGVELLKVEHVPFVPQPAGPSTAALEHDDYHDDNPAWDHLIGEDFIFSPDLETLGTTKQGVIVLKTIA